MVEGQLRPNRVTDPAVLGAFRHVAREDFVSGGLRDAAYADENLPIGGGRCLIAPMILGRLVQEAAITQGDRVLVAGCASGYAAAIAARLADRVVALDPDPGFADRAGRALGHAPNVTLVTGPIAAGAPASGPFDVILLAGAVPRFPQALIDQLAEGGRLLGVLRPEDGSPGHMAIVERIGGALSRRSIGDAAVPLLPGFAPAPAFSF